MKYQKGHQFLIRTPYDNLPFRVRICEVFPDTQEYKIQQIGNISVFIVSEETFTQWIKNVDGK